MLDATCRQIYSQSILLTFMLQPSHTFACFGSSPEGLEDDYSPTELPRLGQAKLRQVATHGALKNERGHVLGVKLKTIEHVLMKFCRLRLDADAVTNPCALNRARMTMTSSTIKHLTGLHHTPKTLNRPRGVFLHDLFPSTFHPFQP